MLKLMIVDDEYLIRQYIRNCIDWEEIGYTIVGELGSAQGALHLAEKIRPDVVLTDICMPGLVVCGHAENSLPFCADHCHYRS